MVVEAQDPEAERRGPRQGRDRRRQLGTEEMPDGIVRHGERRHRLSRDPVDRHPVNVDVPVLMDNRLRARHDVDANEGATIAATARGQPEAGAVRCDTEQSRVELLDVKRLQPRPFCCSRDLEVEPGRARLAQAGARPAGDVRQPGRHVAGVFSQQRRLPRREAHAIQVEHGEVAPVGGDDDVVWVAVDDPVHPRGGPLPRREVYRTLVRRVDRHQVDVVALVAVPVLDVQDTAAVGRPVETEDRARRVRVEDAGVAFADRPEKDGHAALVRADPADPRPVRRDLVAPVRLTVAKELPERQQRWRPAGRRRGKGDRGAGMVGGVKGR